MHNGKFVFSQLLDFIDSDVFLRISNRYNGNRYVKNFTCWNQLAVMMFGQLSNRESLRDVVSVTRAHAAKAFHLGFGKAATWKFRRKVPPLFSYERDPVESDPSLVNQES